MPNATLCNIANCVSFKENACFSGPTVKLITVRSNCETTEASAIKMTSHQPALALGQVAPESDDATGFATVGPPWSSCSVPAAEQNVTVHVSIALRAAPPAAEKADVDSNHDFPRAAARRERLVLRAGVARGDCRLLRGRRHDVHLRHRCSGRQRGSAGHAVVDRE